MREMRPPQQANSNEWVRMGAKLLPGVWATAELLTTVKRRHRHARPGGSNRTRGFAQRHGLVLDKDCSAL